MTDQPTAERPKTGPTETDSGPEPEVADAEPEAGPEAEGETAPEGEREPAPTEVPAPSPPTVPRQRSSPEDSGADLSAPELVRPQPTSRRSGGWIVWLAVLVTAAIVVAAAGFVYLLFGHIGADPARAAVGDCLDRAGEQSQVRRVDCDAPAATWLVTHRVEGVTEQEFGHTLTRERLCEPAPEWEWAFWSGTGAGENGTGALLCLSPRR